MIKLPIKPLTPPIYIDTPKPPKPPKPQEPQKPQTPGHSSGGGGGQAGGTAPDIPSFEALFSAMLRHYIPETVEFTPLDESVLSETIRNWLRPAYEQAIRNRRERTEQINAELDADAWSRGMGTSTYLSDIKERQYRGEARDVSTLESSYASELAGHLFDAMKEQQEKKIEVDEFNAEQINRSREQAMSAAQALYKAFLSGAAYGSGGGHAGASSGSGAAEEAEETMLSLLLDAGKDKPKSDYRTIANLIVRMSPQERKRLYDSSDPKYLTLRSEILWSLSADDYKKLMQQFPGA